ncbi:MAG: hypothetical protein WA366_18725, partial [Pseudolabrys sp.]
DCAVNAVERVLVALPEVHRAGTKGVPVAAIGGDAIRSLGALFIADLTLAFAPGLVGVFIGVGLWGLYLGLCPWTVQIDFRITLSEGRHNGENKPAHH